MTTIKEEKWIKARWEGVMFQQNYLYFEKVCSTQKKLFGNSFKIMFMIARPHTYWWGYRKDFSLNFGKYLVEKFLKEGFGSFEGEYLNVVNSMQRLCSYLEQKMDHLSEFSNKDLADLYLKILNTVTEFAAYTLTCEAVELYLEKILKEKLVRLLNNSEKKIDEYFTKLTTPVRLSFVQEEENELIDIAEKKRKGKDIKNLIAKHAKKWWFIKNSYAKQMRLDEGYFIKRVDELIKKNKRKIKLDKKEKEKILTSLEDKELINIVSIIEKYIYLHDIRKKELLKWIYYMNLIIKEFAKRLRLNFDDACFLTPYEIINWLLARKRIPKSVIKARKYGVIVFDEKGAHIFTGKKAKMWEEKIFGKIKEKEVKELKGLAASPGIVRGKVKVLSSVSEASKFNKGEILVTSHTTPDWVVIMKKASAIITERGGITSHAAIVSRELGIPCVTGIKNVEEVLKDGDLVEVDANKGIVRILKRAK